MTVKQCDRCKETYNPHAGLIVTTKKPLFSIEMGANQKDLCPNCTEKFFRFLHPEKIEERDEEDDAIAKVIDELHDMCLRMDDGPFTETLESAQVLLRATDVENKILRKEIETYESNHESNK